MGRVHFLNVDEGDCSIIQHASNRVSVIDVCCARVEQEETTVKKAGLGEGLPGNFNQKESPENPIRYLARLGVTNIFRFILTHPDMDHMDGIADLFGRVPPSNFWDTANNKEIDENSGFGPYREEDWLFYKNLRDAVQGDTPKRLTLYSGDSGQFWNRNADNTPGSDGLYVLAPTPDLVQQANDSGDHNDLSYVIEYRSAGGRVLFAGDSHDGTWEHLLTAHKNAVSNVDVLIAPHHGRHSDRDFEFLDVVRPKLTLFGNAKSEHLAYGSWSSRGLAYITNNQAGSVIVDLDASPIRIFVSNEKFARAANPRTYYSDLHLGWFLLALT